MYYDSNRKTGCIVGIVIVVIILIMAISIPSCSSYYSTKTYTATVTDKQVKNYSDDSKYLVYTKLENGETRVFSIEDSFIKGRFNSSDVWPDIQVGKTYEFECIGWRNQFMSWYENILEFSEVNPNSSTVEEE